MPVLTLEDSNYAGIIPEDEVLGARITAVAQKKKPFLNDDGSEIWRMEFSFVIEDPNSPFDGTRLWGETSVIFNNHPDCRLHSWAQEILGMDLEPGFNLNTDDLVGMSCRVVIGIRKYTKDGQDKERNFVRDVMRARGLEDEEPF
jgi:hypothetical protein